MGTGTTLPAEVGGRGVSGSSSSTTAGSGACGGARGGFDARVGADGGSEARGASGGGLALEATPRVGATPSSSFCSGSDSVGMLSSAGLRVER